MIKKDHILPFFAARDWEGLLLLLSQLSNQGFRQAERIVRESVLPSVSPAVFWLSLRQLMLYRKAAFITGVLAIERQLENSDFSLSSPEAKAFAQTICTQQPESVPKILNMVLPLLKTEGQIDELFALFCVDNMAERVASLLKIESPLAYFVLFKTLKMMPDNQELGRKCCLFIMKRNNDMAFNMVSILRTYFDFADIKSRLALSIDTYELNYLDRNYDTFLHLLYGKRPKL